MDCKVCGSYIHRHHLECDVCGQQYPPRAKPEPELEPTPQEYDRIADEYFARQADMHERQAICRERQIAKEEEGKQ